MRSGTIEHWIEIPIQVHYTAHPKERQTMTYPGSPGGIEIDDIEIPTQKEINGIISGGNYLDEIVDACKGDLKEGEI